jgi:hypothetical protein
MTWPQISTARPKPTIRGTGSVPDHPALVPAAVDQRRDPYSRRLAADVEGADTLRPVDQVRGARQEIDPRRLHVHWDLADGLRRVRVKDDPLLLGEAADRPHVLDRADLVVREHDREKNRLVGDRPAKCLDVHEPVRTNRNVRHLVALPLQALADVQACALLDGGRDDVVALLPVHLDDPLDRKIDGLGPTGREDHFLRIPGADDLGDLLARAIDGILGFPAEGVVSARRMAELLREIGDHRLHDPWVDGRGRLRIHENGKLQRHQALSICR